MTTTAEAMSIGELSAETGLSAHTLRFYEQENLFVNPVARDSTGRRVYGRSDVQWLQLLTRLRDSGMPLADLARYTELVRAGEGNEQQRIELLREHQDKVRRQMDRLAASLEAVSRKVELYESALAGGHPDRPWQDGEGDCVVPAPPVRSGRQQPPKFTGHARSGG
ncbi:MerR family transcriptional regulator [Kineosporia rhizophila]|uniref:MerR family transcriptional regulator n=1 Tax=Kineosporia TaxID=49184 RepID=UPI001E507417|nr:MerR family transcriptional regulator [Kineosporia sp. NBRC 101677]MCE0540515.1 MerR family transcriptional regulator [Kineosporia rhizophila]